MLGWLRPAAAQQPAWSRADVGPGISLLEIPLTLDLRPLFLRADALLPREVGHWRGRRKQHGVESRYRAWRGPLQMALVGDLLRVEAHVRYWLQGRKKVVGGLSLKVGCGVDEPPHQAIVGLLVRLNWGPDWTLHPEYRVMPTRFLDSCKALHDGANELLMTRADGLRSALDRVFSRAVGQDTRVDLSSVRLTALDLVLTSSAIRLRGAASGSLAVGVR